LSFSCSDTKMSYTKERAWLSSEPSCANVALMGFKAFCGASDVYAMVGFKEFCGASDVYANDFGPHRPFWILFHFHIKIFLFEQNFNFFANFWKIYNFFKIF
jgi:hypothetical protein